MLTALPVVFDCAQALVVDRPHLDFDTGRLARQAFVLNQENVVRRVDGGGRLHLDKAVLAFVVGFHDNGERLVVGIVWGRGELFLGYRGGYLTAETAVHLLCTSPTTGLL